MTLGLCIFILGIVSAILSICFDTDGAKGFFGFLATILTAIGAWLLVSEAYKI